MSDRVTCRDDNPYSATNQGNGGNNVNQPAIVCKKASEETSSQQPNEIPSRTSKNQPCADFQQVGKTVGIWKDECAESRKLADGTADGRIHGVEPEHIQRL